MRNRPLPLLALALALAFALVSTVQAAAPVAVAGDPQFAECVDGKATFTLDGTGSSDEDGDPLSYTWTGPFGVAFGPVVEVEAPLGNNEVTLEVDDGNGGLAQAVTNLIVIDTNPPAVGAALNPSLLVPPDGSFRDITATVFVQDVCNVGTSFRLHSITSNEPETQIVVGADYGTPDTKFILGALLTSQGPTPGNRTYTVFYEAEDTQGNIGIGGGEVLVAKEGLLDVSPSKLIFRYAHGNQAPASQQISIQSIAPGTSFAIESNQPWLRVSEQSGGVGTMVDVSVDPSALPAGSHSGALTVTGDLGVSRIVRVQLYVAATPEMFAMPQALSFKHDVSVLPSGAKLQSAPQTRSVFLGALHSQAAFTVKTDAPWLAASAGGATPARITVSASPEGMDVGEYAGSVRIEASNPEHDPIDIPVTLSVIASRGVQAPEFLVNAATMERRPLAPGSLFTGFWHNPFATEAAASGLPLPETLGGLSASIGGRPVRFSYVNRSQFNGQLPMEMGTGVATMELSFQGQPAGSVPVQVLPASPGIFHANGNALAVNPNGTLNGPNNPAPRGSGVAIYLTGQGPTNPLVSDGAAAPSNPFAAPLYPLHLAVDGQTRQPLFAGMAPGLAGLLQVNVPTAGLSPGAHEVVVTINGAPSNGVKIYVGQ